MPKTAADLQKAIQHLEAVGLTVEWVKEMTARLPGLEAALKAGVQGMSPNEDLRQFKAALKCLGYFTLTEGLVYKVPENIAKLKAELATLPPVCALPECAECDARPSPPNWDAPIPYRHVHDRPVPPSVNFSED